MNQFGTDFRHRPADFDKHRICEYINFFVLKTLINELTKLIKDVNHYMINIISSPHS